MTKRGAQLCLLLYQGLAGLSDTATGWLLLIAPQWTLTQMGIRKLPQPIEFASFVGVFVLGVGLAYLYSMRIPMNAANAPRWQTAWVLTALIRTLVAAFLVAQILHGRMEFAWFTVAVADGALALIQWTGLAMRWLDFAG
jgi:hypothetical protein